MLYGIPRGQAAVRIVVLQERTWCPMPDNVSVYLPRGLVLAIHPDDRIEVFANGKEAAQHYLLTPEVEDAPVVTETLPKPTIVDLNEVPETITPKRAPVKHKGANGAARHKKKGRPFINGRSIKINGETLTLSGQTLQALEAIHEVDKGDGALTADIKKFYRAKNKETLTPRLTDLKRRGFIISRKVPGDKLHVHYVLTKEGREVARAFAPATG